MSVELDFERIEAGGRWKLEPGEWEALIQKAREAEGLRAGLKRLFDEKRPGYHDCIDAGEPECAWCEAENLLNPTKGTT